MSTQFAPIWNNASVDFSCIKANVTDTNSGSNSTLMDLQVGGSSKFKVNKSGQLGGTTLQTDAYGLEVKTSVTGAQPWAIGVGTYYWILGRSDAIYGWTSGTGSIGNSTSSPDTAIARDAAGVIAQRNSNNAQTYRLYGTYTDASNYERGKLEWSSNVFRIGTEKAGTGSARALELQTDGTTRLTIASTGAATFSSSIDCTSVLVNGSQNLAEFTHLTRLSLSVGGGGYSVVRLGGVYQSANTLITIGGTTSSFPAIKRNGTAINFRLADDSADAPITASQATLSATLDLTIRTVTYGATMAIDAALGNKISITLTGNGTISNPTNAVDGRVLVFRLRQDGSGNRVPVWDTKYSFVGDLATVTLSTAANSIDRVAFEYDATDDKWYCISFLKGS